MSVFQIMVRRKPTGGQFFFGVPLFAVWLCLLPLAILAFPLIAIVSLVEGINPFTLAAALCRTLASLKGTHVEFEDEQRTFVLRVA
jgi:hypothetical protein